MNKKKREKPENRKKMNTSTNVEIRNINTHLVRGVQQKCV